MIRVTESLSALGIGVTALAIPLPCLSTRAFDRRSPLNDLTHPCKYIFVKSYIQ